MRVAANTLQTFTVSNGYIERFIYPIAYARCICLAPHSRVSSKLK